MSRRSTTDPINWDATKADSALIKHIVMRAIDGGYIRPIDDTDVRMSLTACHLNGCPLKLAELLKADDFNFVHDVIGINRHVSRDTGKLLNHFLPRFHGKAGESA